MKLFTGIGSYSQGVDLLANEGACFSNSLYRYSLALENPRTELTPGASALTRMRQISYKLEPKIKKKIGDLASIGEARIAKRYRLNIIDSKESMLSQPTEDLSADNRNYDQVVEQIGQFAKVHPMMLLAMSSPSGRGHAINVQWDTEDKIYRIIDDNIGLCVYKNEKELMEALTTMLPKYYPKMDYFRLSAYERLPEPPK